MSKKERSIYRFIVRFLASIHNKKSTNKLKKNPDNGAKNE